MSPYHCNDEDVVPTPRIETADEIARHTFTHIMHCSVIRGLNPTVRDRPRSSSLEFRWRGPHPSGNRVFSRRGASDPSRWRSAPSTVQSSASSGPDRARPEPTYKERLAAFGISGVASYGLFNTLYYFFSFLAVLISLPKPPNIDSISIALQHVLKLLAIVWAGSQVTKLPRAACALACAPLVEKLLDRISSALRFKGGKRDAFFYVVVPFCWGLFFALLSISVIFLRV